MAQHGCAGVAEAIGEASLRLDVENSGIETCLNRAAAGMVWSESAEQISQLAASG
jgi:hypothetical protein